MSSRERLNTVTWVDFCRRQKVSSKSDVTADVTKRTSTVLLHTVTTKTLKPS